MLLKYAPMAELADAPDLGSGVPDVKVQVLFGAPNTASPNLLVRACCVSCINYKLELQFALRIALLRAEIKGKKERPRKRGS